jgi:hypothetical protein
MRLADKAGGKRGVGAFQLLVVTIVAANFLAVLFLFGLLCLQACAK